MKKLVQFGNVLSKDQQRKILGGDYENGACIFCDGFGGACGTKSSSCWYRTNPNGDDCKPVIYPGCDLAIGTVGPCQSWCTTHN